jgi:hypothetical protein
MNKIYDILPPKRSEIEEVLAIMFLGPTNPDKKAILQDSFAC